MEELLIPLFGIVGVFGMPVFIIWIIFYFGGRREKQFHQSLQELIKSGQELSPELLQSLPGYKHEHQRKRNDIRTGTITAGVGIGIALFGQFGVAETALVGIGLLVFSIGLAFLAFGIYSKDKKVDNVS
ncbi:MAG TPA: DUF202 domain-containing protein [Porticoccaceae bacterium]|jgi:hypothetical protein|nr:DUF202 domain-containing protein [Gammaproteobacteria bacterium]HIL61286.1 DUF202 domain-containing protein [Porticoccaceae bacterium]